MTLSRVTPPVALLVSLLLAIGLILATLPSTTAAPFDPRTAIGPLAEPADWMNSARGLPDGRAYAAALDAAGEVEALTAEVDPALAAAEWTLMGPTNIGGRVTDLAVDPTRPDTVWVAAASGGVWRSDDAGATVEPAWPDDLTPAIGALAVTVDGVLFAGTGEANPGGGSFTFGGTGMYRSSDAGATWEQVGLDDTAAFGRILVHPTDPDVIWAAAAGHLYLPGGQRGLYRSTDGGDSWELVLEGLNDTTGAVDLAMDPTDPDRVYVAMWDHLREPEIRTYGGVGSGLWATRDGGETWSVVNAGDFGPGNADIGRIGVAVAPSSPDVVYVSVIDTFGRSSGNGLFRSVDGGSTWERMGSVPSQSSFGWWFGRIFVDPADADRVWIPGVSLSVSSNGGSSFSSSGGVHADQHAMVWDPAVEGRVYLGNDGGLYRSDVNGGSWQKATGEAWTQLYTLDVSDLDPSKLLAGLQDNGCVRNHSLGSAPAIDGWDSFGCGDGLEVQFNPTVDSTIYGCSQYGACSRYALGGELVGTPFVGTSVARTNWMAPVEFHGGSSTTMYYGSERVNVSLDTGLTWQAISPDLTGGGELEIDPAGYPYQTLTTIAGAASDPSVVWAGSDDGLVHRTVDGGGTWERVGEGVLPGDWVTRITIDPADADVVYVTFSGFRTGDDAARVFLTRDGGETWAGVSGNLPAAPVNDLVLVGDGRVVVATDVGVFVTSGGSGDPVWLAVGGNLPKAPAMDLDVQPGGLLTVATFGRSAWRVQLPSVPAGSSELPSVLAVDNG